MASTAFGVRSCQVIGGQVLDSRSWKEDCYQHNSRSLTLVLQARTTPSKASLMVLTPVKQHHSAHQSPIRVQNFKKQTNREAMKPAPRCLPVARTSEASTETAYHVLPGGERLEVLERKAKGEVKAPIVFVHGSYHAAWCWEQHWMGYFADRGYDTYAISLLGQGNSSVANGPVGGTIFSHAESIADVIRARIDKPPILVGHSFGGLVVQAYLAGLASSDDDAPGLPPLAAAALLCSVPPTGNSEMVKRITMRTPIAAMRLTWSLAAKGFANNLALCRDSFFSPDMPDADVARYQKLLASSSKQPLIDLRAVSRYLPVKKPPEGDPPIMVMAAAKDFVVDKEGGEETATFYKTEAIVVSEIAHDVMLDVRWKDAAEQLLSWFSGQQL